MAQYPPDRDGDVQCPTCGEGMKFLKRKRGKTGYGHDGYSDWRCMNKKCPDYAEPDDNGRKIHRIYDDGDCEEL